MGLFSFSNSCSSSLSLNTDFFEHLNEARLARLRHMVVMAVIGVAQERMSCVPLRVIYAVEMLLLGIGQFAPLVLVNSTSIY